MHTKKYLNKLLKQMEEKHTSFSTREEETLDV
jgi:hypothetical protein